MKTVSENVKEQVLKLMFDYNKNNRLLDNLFIETLVDTIIMNYNLEGYVSSLNFNKTQTSYNTITKELSFGTNMLKTLNNYQTKELNIVENNYQRYLYMIFVIFHEIDHALHNPERIKSKKDLESRIIYLILNEIERLLNTNNIFERTSFNLRFKLVYSHYHDCCFFERIANINAIQRTINIAQALKKELPNNYKVLIRLLSDIYLQDYVINQVPTKYFLEKIGFINIWEEINNKTKHLNFETKLRYGLGVSEEERNQILIRKKQNLS